MANFEKQNVQDMVTRFLATKNGTYVKDGNIYLDGGEQSAIVSFLPDNKIEVKLSNKTPEAGRRHHHLPAGNHVRSAGNGQRSVHPDLPDRTVTIHHQEPRALFFRPAVSL